MVGRGRDDGVLVGVVDDARHLLGVALEDGHHLLRVLVEHGRVAVVAARQQAAVVRRVDVQRQDARHAGRVQALGSTLTSVMCLMQLCALFLMYVYDGYNWI